MTTRVPLSATDDLTSAPPLSQYLELASPRRELTPRAEQVSVAALADARLDESGTYLILGPDESELLADEVKLWQNAAAASLLNFEASLEG